jgi:ABC-2 type transport system permease protein
MIKLFLRIVRLSLQQQLTYRMAILSGLATNFFFAFLRVSVMTALYAGQTEVNGLSLEGAITYVAVSQGLIAFLFIFGTWDVMASVYNGSIGADLLRPLPFFALWMARDLGRSLVNLVLRGFLLMAAFALFYPLLLPSSLEQWLFLPLAMGLGWLVSYAWRFLVNLAAFWSPDARGIGRIAVMVMGLLSGFLMPLRLYPDWFANLCRLTPFPALFNTTLEVYLGLLSGPALWMALVNQLFWALALSLLAQLVLLAGVRRLVVQGG